MPRKALDTAVIDLSQAFGLLVRRVRAAAAAQELSLTEAAVLARLAKDGPATTADLARALAMRVHNDMSDRPQNSIYRRSHRLPARFRGCQLLPAGRGEPVDARPPAGILDDPLSADPPGLFHAVEGRIERALLGMEDVAGPVLDGGHDGVAMKARPARKDFQDQQVERALERVGFRHTKTS